MICMIQRLALTVSDVCLKLGCFQSTWPGCQWVSRSVGQWVSGSAVCLVVVMPSRWAQCRHTWPGCQWVSCLSGCSHAQSLAAVKAYMAWLSVGQWVSCLSGCSHAQSLAAVKAYMAWLSIFYSSSHCEQTTSHSAHQHHRRHDDSSSSSTQRCDAMLASVLDAVIPLLTTRQTVSSVLTVSYTWQTMC